MLLKIIIFSAMIALKNTIKGLSHLNIRETVPLLFKDNYILFFLSAIYCPVILKIHQVPILQGMV